MSSCCVIPLLIPVTACWVWQFLSECVCSQWLIKIDAYFSVTITKRTFPGNTFLVTMEFEVIFLSSWTGFMYVSNWKTKKGSGASFRVISLFIITILDKLGKAKGIHQFCDAGVWDCWGSLDLWTFYCMHFSLWQAQMLSGRNVASFLSKRRQWGHQQQTSVSRYVKIQDVPDSVH